MIIADLHNHSHYSDGTETPAELVARARANGLRALALTDHDTVAGIRELISASRQAGIHPVPGVEITTAYAGKRIDVLGYYIDYTNQELLEFLEHITALRTENTRTVLSNLGQLGLLDFSWEDVVKHSDGKPRLGNTDVFLAMEAAGSVSWQEALEFCSRFFGHQSPGYVELGGVSAADAVAAIVGAGGIPVVAHPKLIGDDSQVELLVPHGLMGIEVFYPAHSPADTKRYAELAKRHGLLMTGGTDWHGRFHEWDAGMGGFGLNQELFDIFLGQRGQVNLSHPND